MAGLRLMGVCLVALGLAVGAENAWCKAAPKSSSGSSVKSAPAPKKSAQNYAAMDLVDAATAAGYKTFVGLLQTAGLTEQFKGEKAYTLFIPTDAAFAALPAGTIETISQDPARLKTLLLNHVVSGNMDLARMVQATGSRTLGGADLSLKKDGKNILISGATLVKPETLVKNGRFSGIDRVLLPPPPPPAPARL